MSGNQMMGIGWPEVLILVLPLLSWLSGLAISIRRLNEKVSVPRLLYVLLAVVAGPLGIFVAAAVWLTFPPESKAGASGPAVTP